MSKAGTKNNWKEIQLAKECSFERGVEPGAKAYNTDGIGSRFIRVVDVTDSRDQAIYVDIVTNKRVTESDILLTLDGTIGAVKRGLRGVYSTGVRKVSFVSDNSNDYLYYLLQSNDIQKTIWKYSSGSTIQHAGAAIPYLKAKIPVLPTEQREIARILCSLDDVIADAAESVQKYERVRLGLIQDLFSKGVDHTKMVRVFGKTNSKKSELGLIPNDWSVSNIGSLRQTITSGSRGWAKYYADEGALFVRIGNLNRGNLNLRHSDNVYVKPPVNGEGSRTMLKKGDVLISITADLGLVGLVPAEFGEAYINQHIALVRFEDNESLAPWVAYYLSSEHGQKQFVSLNDGGAKAGLNLPTIDSILVPVPPKSERDHIVSVMQGIESQLEKSKRELNKYKQIKRGLLEDLLSGSVLVT